MFHKIAFLKYDYLNKKTIAYLDDGSEFFYYQKPIKIINDWCIYNGSTAEGRMTAFQKRKRYIIGTYKHKISCD